VKTRNITLALPEEDLRRARVLAAQRGTSVSRLLAAMLRELIEQETGYQAAMAHALASMEAGSDLGTHGRITWRRDELHER
jgi:hypothetical protein